MGAILGLGGLVGIIVSIVLLVIKAIKKQPKKKTLIALGVCLICFIIGLVITPNAPSKPETTEPTESAISDDNPEADVNSEPVSFILSFDQLGEYGKEVVLNAGTEFEENRITFYLPAGKYDVSNLNSSGGEQVSVYCGINEDGEWEEFDSNNCPSPIVLMAGDTKELEIKEGQFVVIADGGTNLKFVLK